MMLACEQKIKKTTIAGVLDNIGATMWNMPWWKGKGYWWGTSFLLNRRDREKK